MSDRKRIYDLLVALLRCSLGIDHAPLDIAAEDREVLIRLAQRQAILPLVAEYLSCEQLQQQQLVAAYRFEQYQSIVSAVSDCLSKDKIPFILLKGSVTCRFYPQPWMRTRSDIDILIPREQLEPATRLLTEQLKYKIESRNYHDVTLRAPNGLFLELHFSLLEKEAGMDRVLATVWDHAKPKCDGACEHVMSDAFFLFHQSAHAAYHFSNGGCGVRFVVDLWLLEQQLSPERAVFRKLCEQSGLQQFYEQLQRLMQYWFANGVADELLLQTEGYLIDGTVFGTMKNRIAIEQNRSGGRIGFIFSRLLWSYEALKELYPSLEGKRYLLPFYQMRRWLRLLNPKKFKIASKQLAENNSVRQEQAQHLHDFLSRMGL